MHCLLLKYPEDAGVAWEKSRQKWRIYEDKVEPVSSLYPAYLHPEVCMYMYPVYAYQTIAMFHFLTR